MNVLLEIDDVVPVNLYGGTQRVVWYLAKALKELGHNVYLLARKGSYCPYANVIDRNIDLPISAQIPDFIDVVHFTGSADTSCTKPYVVTIHGNEKNLNPAGNSIFVSRNHAERNASKNFVYNGLDWEDYGEVSLGNKREYYHFLAKAAWRVKNVRGAIRIIDKCKGEHLKVLGGTRLNLKMGFRLTLSLNCSFHGMVGGEQKNALLRASKGLIFPVLWDEPFGLALIESMYFGAPVFGTMQGSLPELIHSDVGFLSDSEDDLIAAIKENNFSPKICHEYARDMFSAQVMAQNYLKKYEQVINNGTLEI